MPKKPKKNPADPSQLALSVVETVIGERLFIPTDPRTPLKRKSKQRKVR